MYRVHLKQFEGPLDLLLFFIRRDELDLYDIPIAHIADEFLAYVRLMERIDLDGVGEFIYMASLLINLKARMLLPGQETDEEGEPIDPRRELVERLLEYVRFKEASQQLDVQRTRRADRFTRGKASSEREALEATPELQVEATIFDLVSALGDILTDTEQEEEPVHAVERVEYTVEEQQAYVLERIRDGRPMSFRMMMRTAAASLASRVQVKAFVIATFLAVLELARQKYLCLTLAGHGTDFMVARRIAAEGDGALASPTFGEGNGSS